MHDFKHERFKLKCPIMLQFAYFWRRSKISTLIFHFDYIKDTLNNRNYNYWLHLSSVRTDPRWLFDLLYDQHSYKRLTNWYHLKALDECVSAIIDCYKGFSEHKMRSFRAPGTLMQHRNKVRSTTLYPIVKEDLMISSHI